MRTVQHCKLTFYQIFNKNFGSFMLNHILQLNLILFKMEKKTQSNISRHASAQAQDEGVRLHLNFILAVSQTYVNCIIGVSPIILALRPKCSFI